MPLAPTAVIKKWSFIISVAISNFRVQPVLRQRQLLGIETNAGRGLLGDTVHSQRRNELAVKSCTYMYRLITSAVDDIPATGCSQWSTQLVACASYRTCSKDGPPGAAVFTCSSATHYSLIKLQGSPSLYIRVLLSYSLGVSTRLTNRNKLRLTNRNKLNTL